MEDKETVKGQELGKYFVISAKGIVNAHKGQVRKVWPLSICIDLRELSLKEYSEYVIIEIGLS